MFVHSRYTISICLVYVKETSEDFQVIGGNSIDEGREQTICLTIVSKMTNPDNHTREQRLQERNSIPQFNLSEIYFIVAIKLHTILIESRRIVFNYRITRAIAGLSIAGTRKEISLEKPSSQRSSARRISARSRYVLASHDTQLRVPR